MTFFTRHKSGFTFLWTHIKIKRLQPQSISSSHGRKGSPGKRSWLKDLEKIYEI
ncbi:hypothetical protein BVRB_7g172660 [Beta vulgaris subsp. vulgaris]|nr:hypothetical protein BVRB_7g172660 [Beta vulgaris subsp. vulgaris]